MSINNFCKDALLNQILLNPAVVSQSNTLFMQRF